MLISNIFAIPASHNASQSVSHAPTQIYYIFWLPDTSELKTKAPKMVFLLFL